MTKLAFISHASEDVAVAQVITDYLERNGVTCWIASRDADPGSDYSSEIIEGIESSAVFVLVLSENANESAFVKREVERAVSKAKPVFPIRVREVLPSKALELFISSAHWIDAWQPPLEKYLERLAEAISAAVGAYPATTQAAGSMPAKIGTRSSAPGHQRVFMILLAAIISLILGGAGWYAFRFIDQAGSTTIRRGLPTVTNSNTNQPPTMKPDVAQTAAIDTSAPYEPTAGPEACPSSLGINPNLPTPFTCTCSAAAAATAVGFVAGTDVYIDGSNLCLAAVHAGAITAKGGLITVVRSEGRPYYVGSSRNGVATLDFGSYTASIVFK